MKKYDFNDCMKEKLLRKIPPSKEKVEESINTAKKWLGEAEKSFQNEAFNSSVMASYLAMFHSARAILFYDGFREKSHYCVARYLEEKYVRKQLLETKWIELLDHYRELRHDDQYSTTFFATEEEAENGIKKAEEFVERMEKLLTKCQEKLCPKCKSNQIKENDSKLLCKDCGFIWEKNNSQDNTSRHIDFIIF